MNIIIPMAGLGARFTNYGFTTNKYLLPTDLMQTKMIENAILTLNIPSHIQPIHFIFIIREENGIIEKSLRNDLEQLCQKHSYQCTILSTDHLTEGPTCTAYLARSLIDNDIPLMISNSDQILDWDCEHFLEKCSNYDGAVLTYKPDYELIYGNKDKHSFVRIDIETTLPVEFSEKIVISDDALVGVHYYKKGKYFIEGAESTFAHNIRAPNGEFY